MRSICTFKWLSAACVISLFSVYSTSSYSQVSAADAQVSVFPDTIQLPKLEMAGPSTFIKFRFPGKENASRIDIVEHFDSRVYRLFENGEVLYGLYAFDGDPLKDEKFKAYYMNMPRDKDDPVIFKFDFDNKTGKFKLNMITKDGEKINAEGTFELAADIK